MATITKGGYCPVCQQKRMGQKEVLGDGFGCILCLLTVGLFLPVWIFLKMVNEWPKPYRCTVCGTGLQ